MTKNYELIDKLDLSIRAFNCLARAGITTVDELINTPQRDLVHVRNMGQKTLKEINEKVEKYIKEHSVVYETDGNALLEVCNEFQNSEIGRRMEEVAKEYGLYPKISFVPINQKGEI